MTQLLFNSCVDELLKWKIVEIVFATNAQINMKQNEAGHKKYALNDCSIPIHSKISSP